MNNPTNSSEASQDPPHRKRIWRRCFYRDFACIYAKIVHLHFSWLFTEPELNSGKLIISLSFNRIDLAMILASHPKSNNERLDPIFIC
jgi:hypothetical protein